MPEYIADEAYHVVRLRDGRQLSYAQYGDPGGFAILNAHGGLACRLDVAGAAPAAELCKVRLVSPDLASAARTRNRAEPSWTGPETSPNCLTGSMSTGLP